VSEPTYLPIVHHLLGWLRTHGPADRHDVPPALEDALTLCLTESKPLAHIYRSDPRPGPMPPTVDKLAIDLQPGDVIDGHRTRVKEACPVPGGVEVFLTDQSTLYYRRTNGREPQVAVYAGPLPIPAEPRTLVGLTPAGETWISRNEASRRIASSVPTAAPVGPIPTIGAKYADESQVPAAFREGGKPDGKVLTVRYVEDSAKWRMLGPYISNNFGSDKPLTTYVKVGRANVYLYAELLALRDKRDDNKDAADDMAAAKQARGVRLTFPDP